MQTQKISGNENVVQNAKGDNNIVVGRVEGSLTINYRHAIGKHFQAPPLPTYYVDRPEYTKDLKNRLLAELPDTRSLVVSAIHGLGSVGKSTLATALAHDLDVQTHYSDGILWATLGQQPDVLSLLSGWVQALGDYDFKPTSIKAATTHLRTLLHDKAILLVVDDAWEPEHAQAFSVGGSRCQVLVTTREGAIADALGASTYSLDVMKPEQAMELLTNKLGRDLKDAERQPAADLAKAVGYLPLALELAVAQVVSNVSWATLLKDIQGEIARLKTFDRPGATGSSDEASSKKLSLTASFNLSIQRLEDFERENFTWLGVLPEDATITDKMVVTLWDLDDAREASDILEDLRSKALLLPGVTLGDETRTYRLHDLLHDLARNLLTAPTKPKRRGDLPGLGLKLVDVHNIFLERYKEKTKNGQWHTLPDDGYIHQRLTWHFEKALKTEEIHLLLQEETETGRNGWFEACDRLGQTANFVIDIARAWKLAEKMFEEKPTQSIALQCRYALITTSLNSLAKNIPGSLIAALVKQKLWSQAQGLAYVQQTKESNQRAEALSALAPYLSESLLSIALEAALGIQSDSYRASALSGLAPHLSEVLLEKALEVALSIKDDRYRASALTGLAPHLSEVLLEKALEVVLSIKYYKHRTKALTGLAPHLSEVLKAEVLEKALEVILSIKDDYNRADALTGLAPHLSEVLKAEVLEKALEVALSIKDDDYSAKTLTGLAPHLSKALLEKALEATLSIKDDYDRADALTGLAPHLSEALKAEVLEKALEVALSIKDDYDRADALTGLAPHLSKALLEKALEAAFSIKNDYYRAEALTGLAPHLSEVLKAEVLEKALEVILSIKDDDDRAKALTGLAPHLSEVLLEKALEVALSIKDDDDRAKALTGLAPHLSEVLLEKALEIARSIKNDKYRTKALTGLAPHLSEALKAEVLEKALEATLSIKYDYYSAKALTGLAPHLSEVLLEKALEATFSIKYYKYRAEALTGLAPHLSEVLKAEVLEKALEVILSIKDDDDSDSAKALTGLAPHLSEVLLEKALEVALSIKNYDDRAKALTGLAPHLSEVLLEKALEATLSIKNDKYRAEALTGLAPHLTSIKFDLWCEILHNLSYQFRDQFLQNIPILSDAIIELGGIKALSATVSAIQEVCRQWR
ncbi:MAG: hypothetical protein KME46_28280 [Brasilonema angustatum HA4187-MV1]|jgi:spore coat polysaccharide biosynthesis protein SpsF (cytidylyltransferase family)|nr:hypothetical protein [Brasilonema angustatum HA4187-MV1]